SPPPVSVASVHGACWSPRCLPSGWPCPPWPWRRPRRLPRPSRISRPMNWRLPANSARDVYRHPKATLQFFGVRPDQTIVEITPGGGWYSEILAPLLNDNGHYVAAVAAPKNSDEARRDDSALQRKFAADPAHYGHARIVEFDPHAPVFGAPGSANMVLTFRNVHNWVMAGTAPAMFKAFFAVLRPGGVLGVVDHRAADDTTLAATKGSGYLPTGYVVGLATDAGFVLDGSS